MVGQLYQVSYLGATYYAVPVYYPGSVVFQSWYLIAFVNGQLVPYTIVPGNAVVILYNPYLGGSTPTPPGTPTPPSSPGTPTAGVLTLNGLTGTLTIAATGGIVASQSGSTITLTGSGGSSTGITQAQADALYAPLPTSATPGIPSPSPGDPLPQYVLGSELYGSTYKEQATAPTSPVPGQLWKNTSNSTVAGIPSQNYGIWNGTEWVNLGTRPYTTNSDVYGNTYKSQDTAPTSPANGQIWKNTSGSTVAGVPAGQYAVWNGTAWVPMGTVSPFLTPDKAVTSLNTLKGDVVLTPGANITITPTGQNLAISATTGFASNTAPTNPYAGQVWYNSSTSTVSGIPAGTFGVWNGLAWVGVGTAQPQGSLITSATTPTSPTPGTAWQNISGATLSGIPGGLVGVWNGTTWVNTVYTPSTISANPARVGFLVEFDSFTLTNPSSAGDLIIPTSKVYDTFGAFSLGAGTYTVPVSQEGVWLWDIGCSVFNNGAQFFNIFVAINTTTIGITDVLHSANVFSGAVGQRPVRLSAGDVIRFYGNGAFSGNNELTDGSLFATRVQRIA